MFKFIRPEFFDIFGILTFSVLIYLGAQALFFGEQVPHWGLWFLFLIGIAGLIVDGTIVYITYLKRKNKN
ncbi:MAG: hypothetical protein AAB966_01985, partial [Patescibacteria group bacterium]